MKPTDRLLNLFLALLAVAYPFVIFFGIKYADLRILSLILASLLYLRSFTLRKSHSLFAKRIALASRFMATILVVSCFLKGNTQLVRYYPFLINMVLLITFANSLRKERTPIVQHIASLSGQEMTNSVMTYVRQVTWLWSIFFFINASISLYTTVQENLEVWTLYNGFISYLLIGTVFVCEFCVRLYLKRKWKRT